MSGKIIQNQGRSSGLIKAPASGAASTLAAATTVGDASAEDTKIVFDGNALDFRIGIDDGTDTLEIGKGNAHGTTAHMTFDTNGIMSLPLQPGCSVKHSGNQTIPTGTWTKMTFQTERFDTNADYDNSTNYRFTCPVDGIYCVALSVSFSATHDSLSSTAVHINGSELHRSNSSAIKNNAQQNVNTVVFIKLDATDYIEGYAAHEQGSDDTATADYSYMSIMKVA